MNQPPRRHHRRPSATTRTPDHRPDAPSPDPVLPSRTEPIDAVCDLTREVLSARIDGEAAAAESADADAHLLGCNACRAWQLSAHQVTRQIRVRPAGHAPDLTAAILAAHGRIEPRPRWTPARTTLAWRTLLTAVALAQLVMGLWEIVAANAHAGMGMMAGEGTHLFNESTAWNLALGVGFGVAAALPRLAGGLLPTLGVFVAVLGVFSLIDVVSGRADVARVSSHLLVVVGMVLLWLVYHRSHGRPGRDRQLGDPSLGEDALGDTRAVVDEPSAAPGRSQRRLRPSAHRAA